MLGGQLTPRVWDSAIAQVTVAGEVGRQALGETPW